jgi:hypothetical protein
MAKHVLDPIPIASSQSLAANFNTASTTVPFQDNLSYHINITTTNSIGTFNLQGSDDNVNFADTGNTIAVNAANDTGLISINQWPFKYIRLRYTASTAGTGTCNILFHARTVGA